MSNHPGTEVRLTVTGRFKETPDPHTKRFTLRLLDDLVHKHVAAALGNTLDIVEVSISLDGGAYTLQRREQPGAGSRGDQDEA